MDLWEVQEDTERQQNKDINYLKEGKYEKDN